MKPINIKIMMALIEKEPGDQYVPVLKPVLMQILTELKHLRRKNSQLGGKVARMRKRIRRYILFPLEIMNVMTYYVLIAVALLVVMIWKITKKIDAVAIVGSD